MALFVYHPGSFDYLHTIEQPDATHAGCQFATTVPVPPEVPMTRRVFNKERQAWEYKEAIHPPDYSIKGLWLDTPLTYKEIRAREYPPFLEYLDGLVKNDASQVSSYVQQCLDVKSRWQKDMEPITIREYYYRKGILAQEPEPSIGEYHGSNVDVPVEA